MVALDGSALGELALPHVMALVHAFAADLVLLRVVPGTRAVPELAGLAGAETGVGLNSGEAEALAGDELEAESYLEAVATRLHAQGDVPVTIERRVSLGPVARTIAEEAGAAGVDLLALATNKRGGVARIRLGAVAEEVLRLAPCPVLVLPLPAIAQSDEFDEPAAGQVRSFEDDAKRVGAMAPKPLGLRTVDVARIVGSVGRARELGPDFRPPVRSQRRGDDERFQGIVHAIDRGQVLPPIDVYKLGYNYYVLDGNHRVAAAKLRNQPDIDAIVTEFLPVSDEESAQVFNERRDFERATGLTRIGVSRVGHYPRLEAIIGQFAEDHAGKGRLPLLATGADFHETARHWYYTVYQPITYALRKSRLTQCFPSERMADIFVHLANFRDDQGRLTGEHLSWEEALHRFTENYADCAGSIWRRLPGLRRLLRPRLPSTAEVE